jgi:exonuclease III
MRNEIESTRERELSDALDSETQNILLLSEVKHPKPKHTKKNFPRGTFTEMMYKYKHVKSKAGVERKKKAPLGIKVSTTVCPRVWRCNCIALQRVERCAYGVGGCTHARV